MDMKSLYVIAATLVFSVSLARGEERADPSGLRVKIANWPAPPHWSPPTQPVSLQERGADVRMETLEASSTSPLPFIGITPCRLVDTRQAAFPAGFGPPALGAGVPRNFDLNSDPLCPGIPANAQAYSLNVTVTNTLGAGFILIYPQGGAQPTVSTLTYVAGQTVANAAIVPAGTNGGVTVIAGVSGTDLIIDINGYFPVFYNSGNLFVAVTSNDGGAAILGQNNSAASGSHGVGGFEPGAGVVHGVQGEIGANAL